MHTFHRKTPAAVAMAAALFVMAPAPARADSLFGFHAGGFLVRGEDGRVADDVLRENLSFLSFDLGDFNGFTFSGEYLYGFGDYLEVGVGVGYYARTVDSVYTDYVDIDGTEIEQSTKLRIIPVPVTARLFIFGRTTPVQPYVGGGFVFYNWRYSEFGEFIDFSDPSLPVFRDSFADDGGAVGGTILGGVRAPISDRVFLGGEFRWQQGNADLDPALNFAGDRIDLGGFNFMGGVHVRF